MNITRQNTKPSTALPGPRVNTNLRAGEQQWTCEDWEYTLTNTGNNGDSYDDTYHLCVNQSNCDHHPCQEEINCKLEYIDRFLRQINCR